MGWQVFYFLFLLLWINRFSQNIYNGVCWVLQQNSLISKRIQTKLPRSSPSSFSQQNCSNCKLCRRNIRTNSPQAQFHPNCLAVASHPVVASSSPRSRESRACAAHTEQTRLASSSPVRHRLWRR